MFSLFAAVKKVFQVLQLFFLAVLTTFPGILLLIHDGFGDYDNYFIDVTGIVMIAAHTLLAFGTFLYHFKGQRLRKSLALKESYEKALDEDFVQDAKAKVGAPKALAAANAVYGILASFLYVRIALQMPFEGDSESVLTQYILFVSLGYVAVYFIFSSLWNLPKK